MRARLGVLVTAAALAAGPVAAADGTIAAADPSSLAQAMRDAGYEAKLDTDNYGDPLIHTRFGGYGGLVVFYGCDDKTHRGCDSVQLRTGLDRKSPLDADLLNSIMKQRRFAAIWLDDEGDPWINFDVITGAGIPKAVFLKAVNDYSNGVAQVADRVFAEK